MSSIRVANVLKQSGLEVIGMTSIFTYSFPVSENNFKEAGITYYSLTNYPSLIAIAKEKGLVATSQEEILLKWRENPAEWNGVL